MQAYSMDLRERALLDSDAGMKAACEPRDAVGAAGRSRAARARAAPDVGVTDRRPTKLEWRGPRSVRLNSPAVCVAAALKSLGRTSSILMRAMSRDIARHAEPELQHNHDTTWSDAWQFDALGLAGIRRRQSVR